jgi:hypothetical protein
MSAALAAPSAVPVVPAVLAVPSAAPIEPGVLAVPSAVPVVSVAPMVPPVLVSSAPAVPSLRTLCAVVASPVPPVPPLPAGSRVPSRSAQVPPARKAPFALTLRLGASSLLGTAPHDPLPS